MVGALFAAPAVADFRSLMRPAACAAVSAHTAEIFSRRAPLLMRYVIDMVSVTRRLRCRLRYAADTRRAAAFERQMPPAPPPIAAIQRAFSRGRQAR